MDEITRNNLINYLKKYYDLDKKINNLENELSIMRKTGVYKKYLVLLKEVEKLKIELYKMNEFQIFEKCKHDIYVDMGLITEDWNYYNETVTFHRFKCLDCCKTIEFFKHDYNENSFLEEVESFNKFNNVINLKDNECYNDIRGSYFRNLIKDGTEVAKKKILDKKCI